MDDTWRLYRERQITQSSDSSLHDELQTLMNHVLPPAEILATLDPPPAIPLPYALIEKKIKRLQWRWSRIRNYPANLALPVMMTYKKTFPALTNGQKIKLYEEAVRATGSKSISTENHEMLYYTAKPFIITTDDLKEYISTKFRLTPSEQGHIFPGVLCSPPAPDHSASLFLNYDPVRLLRLLQWLDSEEIRFRPGGRGYQQVATRFEENTKRLQQR